MLQQFDIDFDHKATVCKLCTTQYNHVFTVGSTIPIHNIYHTYLACTQFQVFTVCVYLQLLFL